MRGRGSTIQKCEGTSVGPSSSLLGADRARNTSGNSEMLEILSGLMAPSSGIDLPKAAAGTTDPRLAKLKESSLARRRVSIPERSILTNIDGHVALQSSDFNKPRVAWSHNPGAPDFANATTSTSPPVSTLDAMQILRLDSNLGNTLPEPSSRLQKLQAIRILVLKESPELTQLHRRLCQTKAQLAFHEMNAQHPASGRDSNSPPWIPPAKVTRSKHISANQPGPSTGRPQSANNPRPTPQASALQLKLLLGLQDRLRLKIAFMVLKRAVRVNQLAVKLIDRATILEEHELLLQALKIWAETCLPAQEMLQIAEEVRKKQQRGTAVL